MTISSQAHPLQTEDVTYWVWVRGPWNCPPQSWGASQGLVGKEYITSILRQEALLDTANSHDLNLLGPEISKARPFLFMPSALLPAGPVDPDLGTAFTGSVSCLVSCPGTCCESSVSFQLPTLEGAPVFHSLLKGHEKTENMPLPDCPSGKLVVRFIG